MTTDKLLANQTLETSATASSTSDDTIGARGTRMASEVAATNRDGRSGKVIVGAFVALIAAVFAYFAFGMPGMDHGASDGSSMAGMDMDSPTSRHRVVSPAEFEAMLDDATMLNVHVPDEGEIVGTDIAMPYNALDIAMLPSDKSAKLLVYCLTGRMSAEASAALVNLGYTDVIELDGGMDAWKSSGRQVLDNS